jgi:hypothetical protein
MRETLEDFKATLNKKEAFILDQRLMEDNPLTLRETGETLGISRERAHRMENRVIEKLPGIASFNKGALRISVPENLTTKATNATVTISGKTSRRSDGKGRGHLIHRERKPQESRR